MFSYNCNVEDYNRSLFLGCFLGKGETSRPSGRGLKWPRRKEERKRESTFFSFFQTHLKNSLFCARPCLLPWRSDAEPVENKKVKGNCEEVRRALEWGGVDEASRKFQDPLAAKKCTN